MDAASFIELKDCVWFMRGDSFFLVWDHKVKVGGGEWLSGAWKKSSNKGLVKATAAIGFLSYKYLVHPKATIIYELGSGKYYVNTKPGNIVSRDVLISVFLKS